MDRQKILIFIASPGDVIEERTTVRTTVEQLQDDPFLRRLINLEIIAWDDPIGGIPMLANFTPQEAISKGLPRPSQCDIVVVILWSRIGTPLDIETHGHRPDGEPYQSGTEWEYYDAVNAAKKSGRPLVLVYRRIQKIQFSNEDPQFNEKIRQWKAIESFFAKFYSDNGAFKHGYEVYPSPSEFSKLFEQHLRVLLGDIIGPQQLSSAKPKTSIWHGSPFPGLRPFKLSESTIFVGRERDVDRVLDLVRNHRFAAIVGASGSGKSSLIQAGMLPRLKTNAISDEQTGSQHWIVLVFSPGGNGSRNPIEALVDTLVNSFPTIVNDLSEWPVSRANFVRNLIENPTALPSLCSVLLKDRPAWVEILVIIDQFEELFTIVPREYRGAFVSLLTHTVYSPRVRCLISLRSDFYQECLQFSDLVELLNTGQYALAEPTVSSLQEIIIKPATIAGITFEQDLVDRLLADTGRGSGALALLAFALRQLYDYRNADGRMTLATYENIGGVQGAIGTYAEEIYLSLSEIAREQLWLILRELVEVDERGIATRRSNLLSKMLLTDAARAVIETLTQKRLLVQSTDSGEARVEIVHEALLRHWRRAAEWIESRQADLRLLRQVERAASEWDRAGRLTVFLWPDERLKLIYEAFTRLGINPEQDISSTEHDFIKPETERLVEEIHSPNLPHARRSWIGERLGLLGDPRRGVGVNLQGVPDIVWCRIKSGTVQLTPSGHTIEVPAFCISMYPVTFLQFEVFLSATDGYSESRWWYGLACSRSHRQQQGEQRFKFSNYPRENVGWYEAVAFCRWLSSKLSYEVELPTEAQWQLAASGDKESTFPWGNAWVAEYANTRESGLSRTTAVGVYPLDRATNNGAFDISGNVMEWCLNQFDGPANCDYHGGSDRGVRGGAWNLNHTFARLHYRSGKSPFHRADNLGFRICTNYLVGGE